MIILKAYRPVTDGPDDARGGLASRAAHERPSVSCRRRQEYETDWHSIAINFLTSIVAFSATYRGGMICRENRTASVFHKYIAEAEERQAFDSISR